MGLVDFYWNNDVILRPARAAFRPAAEAVGALARAKAPRRTGRLATSVRVDVAGMVGTEAVLHGGVPYIFPVTKGAEPHEIDPPGNALLSTPYGPRPRVNHPGNRAQPFLADAASDLGELYAVAARVKFGGLR